MNPLVWILYLYLWNGTLAHEIPFRTSDACQIALDYVLEADNYGTNARSVQYGPPHYMHAYCAYKFRVKNP